MTQYETTIVFDSFLKDEDMKNLSTKMQYFIKNNGGQIQQVEDWGKKRLAYEINRKQYGNYVHILFSGPSTLPDLLEREYRLQESILRYLTIKISPKGLQEKNAEVNTPIETSSDTTLEESLLPEEHTLDENENVLGDESVDISSNDDLTVE